MASTGERSAPASRGDHSSTVSTSSAPACDQCRSKKVRCDRHHPTCSNCKKSGASCEFSGRSKRVNQSQQLVNDFTALNARLDSIDQSLASLNQRASAPEVNTATTSNSPSINSASEDVQIFYQPAYDAGSEQGDDHVSPEAFRQLHQRHNDSGGERFYGSTSALSLFETCRELVEGALSAEGANRDYKLSNMLLDNPALKTQINTLLGQFPFLQPWPEPDVTSDGRPVAEPPRSFLSSVIDIYLTGYNSVQPVFDEAKLLQKVKGSPPTISSEAESLCFNNVILLALSLMSQAARRNQFETNAMNDDLISHFINNSRRALGRLDHFHEPRLVNVQALATLAMVAREYWNSHLFSRLCQKACSIAKSMGFQRIRPGNSDPTHSTIDAERASLFWTLYVMDKERSFMSGIPPDLYLFDSDARLGAQDTGGYTLAHYRVARIHMMSLWEEVHISLYSSRVRREKTPQIDNTISKLNSRLTAWAYQHVDLLNESVPPDGPWFPYLRQELKYVFHVAQILIHRCSTSNVSKQCRMAHSRAALNIIKDIHGAAPSLRGAALLRRCFRHYPMLPFLDLYGMFLADPGQNMEETLELLRCTPVALNSVQDPNFMWSYHARLYAGLNWCVKIINAISLASEKPLLPFTQPRPTTSNEIQVTPSRVSSDQPRTTASAVAVENTTAPQPPSKAARRSAANEGESEHLPKKRNSLSYPPRSTIDDFITSTSASALDVRPSDNAASSQLPALFPIDTPIFPVPESLPFSPTSFPIAESAVQPSRDLITDFDPLTMMDTSPDLNSRNDDFASETIRPSQTYYKAGTLDNFMPRLGNIFENLDTDIPRDLLGDSLGNPKVQE